jgi:hypothetical protein
MKAKALVNFNIYNLEAKSGDVVEFGDNTEQAKQMLLNLGWIEEVSEGSSKAASKKK